LFLFHKVLSCCWR